MPASSMMAPLPIAETVASHPVDALISISIRPERGSVSASMKIVANTVLATPAADQGQRLLAMMLLVS